jgi:ketose-bisphosphate aldolase
VIASMSDVLGEPGSGRGVGAFTAYDLEAATGIVRAAEASRNPVILLVSRAAFANAAGPALVAAMRASAERATVPVCIQLDHVADPNLIGRAAELGCGAVMADGSKLDFESNVELVAAARSLVAGAGAEVEGELGHLAGGEDVARAATAGGLTKPDEVSRFVEQTGVRCLAVSIGNVHGSYAAPPQLDWDLLADIRDRTDVHLSLHGASGLDGDLVRRAIELGVTKVNVNLELRRAYMEATDRVLAKTMEGYDMNELHQAQAAAVEAVAAAKIKTFAGIS